MQYLVAPRFQRCGTEAGKRVDDVHEAGRRFGMAIDVRHGANLQIALADGRNIVARGGKRIHIFFDQSHFPRRHAHDLRREQALGGDALFDRLGQRVVAQALVRGIADR